MYLFRVIPHRYMEADYEFLYFKFMLKELYNSKCSVLMVNLKEIDLQVKLYCTHRNKSISMKLSQS